MPGKYKCGTALSYATLHEDAQMIDKAFMHRQNLNKKEAHKTNDS